MRLDGFDELSSDRIERIEAGQRILEDRANHGAAYLAHLFVGKSVDASSLESDLSARHSSRRLEQPDDGVTGQRLARARLAHHAQHLASGNLERHIIDRQQGATPRWKFDTQAPHLEKRRVVRDSSSRGSHQRSFGLRASRSQSPSRLTARTNAASVIPGNTTIHHSPDCRRSLPSRMSVPSDGCVEGSPTPRKDRVASVMMASPRLIVAITSTGPVTLGNTCRTMITAGDRPITRAAWTYSLFFSTSTDPRTVRAYCTQ